MEFLRCYSCMEELPAPGAVCPHCGYDNTKAPAAQPSHVLPCGTVLNGKYLLGRSLGQGGFGITYIGYDLNLELRVCIKEYYPEGAAMRSGSQSSKVYWGTSETADHMRQSRQSFVKEAQKAVKLRDLRHVVSVWDVFFENETAYIVMDFVQGETLKTRLIQTRKVLSEKECMALLGPVMEDLREVHARGIIHRDIKPDNIMLRPNGEPVLLDLGAAKDLSKSPRNGMPSSNLVVSQGFSPPEQYREQGNIGAWTDVYAMCATMYYCVSGRMLPPATDRMYEDKADFRSFSPRFAQMLEKGLAIRTENRIQSMEELLSWMQGIPDGDIPGGAVCRQCGRPIPGGARICPFCHSSQEMLPETAEPALDKTSLYHVDPATFDSETASSGTAGPSQEQQRLSVGSGSSASAGRHQKKKTSWGLALGLIAALALFRSAVPILSGIIRASGSGRTGSPAQVSSVPASHPGPGSGSGSAASSIDGLSQVGAFTAEDYFRYPSSDSLEFTCLYYKDDAGIDAFLLLYYGENRTLVRQDIEFLFTSSDYTMEDVQNFQLEQNSPDFAQVSYGTENGHPYATVRMDGLNDLHRFQSLLDSYISWVAQLDGSAPINEERKVDPIIERSLDTGWVYASEEQIARLHLD